MLPASRLQPAPFPEPGRLVAYLEQDPSLFEEGLSVVAREIPIPAAAEGARLDLLALDAGANLTAISVSTIVTGRTIETCLAMRAWLQENLPTLRAMNPRLGKVAGTEIRSVLLAGRISPAARSIASQLASPRPEIFEVRIFSSTTGPAIAMEPLPCTDRQAAPGSVRNRQEEGVSPDELSSIGNPLAGVPISTEEAEELRKLSVPEPARSRSGRISEPRPTAPSAAPAPGGFLEN